MAGDMKHGTRYIVEPETCNISNMAHFNPFNNIVKLVLLLAIPWIAGCEMEEETRPVPEVVITSPQEGGQLIAGAELRLEALLKGFTEDYKVHRTCLYVNDSMIMRWKDDEQNITRIIRPGNLPDASPCLTLEVTYTEILGSDKDWNYFSIRDYIEKDNNGSDTLTASSSVNISLTAPPSSSVAIAYESFSDTTLIYRNDTIRLEAFNMGKYEVTNQQYNQFLNAFGVDSTGTYGNQKYINLSESTGITCQNGGFAVRSGMANLPVVNVTWAGAQAFCRWVGGRLPTEHEWYWAADTSYTYSGSNTADFVAWHEGNSGGSLHPVGQKDPNGFGIYDMSGNAAEWCLNWYDDNSKTYRGGHWNSAIFNVRTSARFKMPPSNGGNFLGFRVLKPL